MQNRPDPLNSVDDDAPNEAAHVVGTPYTGAMSPAMRDVFLQLAMIEAR